MLRIITPKGVLREAVHVLPVCELRNRFNKRVFRAVEFADGMDARPTALQIEFPSQTMPLEGANLFVGNLKPVTVKGIMQKLLTEGYYDFSTLEYQEAKILGETVFDDGVSQPYTSDYTFGIRYAANKEGFFGGAVQEDIFSCVRCADNNPDSWEESGVDGDDEE